jgi:hypothetical protein
MLTIDYDIFFSSTLLKANNKLLVGENDSFSTLSVKKKVFQVAGKDAGEHEFAVEYDDNVGILESTCFGDLTNTRKFKIIITKKTEQQAQNVAHGPHTLRSRGWPMCTLAVTILMGIFTGLPTYLAYSQGTKACEQKVCVCSNYTNMTII